jgi:hypothetical protein
MESLDQECRDRCDGDGNGATDAALRRRAVIGARAPHAGLALEATPITPTLTLSNPRPARATPRTPPRGHETNPVLHLYARLAPNEPAGPGQRSPRPRLRQMQRLPNTACTATLEPHIFKAPTVRCSDFDP